MKNAIFILGFALFSNTLPAYSQTEVLMVSNSDIHVMYKGEDSYIAYLNKRGISKENVYKDYYTDKFIFDLGKVKTGTVKEIKVPFKNSTADDYIKIKVVNELCACLKAEFPAGGAGNFKPGETKTGKLKFNTKGLSGKVRRGVEIRTYANGQDINYLVWVQAEIVK